MKKINPKSKPIDKDDLYYQEEVEEIRLCDFLPEGKDIAQFTFDTNIIPSNEPMIKVQFAEEEPKVSLNSGSLSKLPDNRALKSEVNGITPPIDGEYFVIKRVLLFADLQLRCLIKLKLRIQMKMYILLMSFQKMDKTKWNTFSG